ncbi:hypothetical protein L596_015342 [Steinernema carpocapsae]|uniref:Uncharacterized protein n=1 Tax=Steinernema carpocapsae TaxID=34508 RepID=A0A4U5NEP9_STECR|nr:hypothetical protein L596_015342 [Steinernema carpocapsae]
MVGIIRARTKNQSNNGLSPNLPGIAPPQRSTDRVGTPRKHYVNCIIGQKRHNCERGDLHVDSRSPSGANRSKRKNDTKVPSAYVVNERRRGFVRGGAWPPAGRRRRRRGSEAGAINSDGVDDRRTS